jgi:membrane protease YdiL (CAAX protease family)
VAGLALGIAPWCEEVVFRGMLLGSFQRLCPVPAAVALSSAVFASFHLAPGLDRLYLVPVFGIGCVLGVLWIKTRSLFCCVLAHGINNAFAFGMVLYSIYS